MSGKKIVVMIIGIVLILGGLFSVFIGLALSSEEPPEDLTEEEKRDWEEEWGTYTMFCITISIIIILVGLVITIMGFMAGKKVETLPAQQPVIYMQQPYQQQPGTIESKVDAKLQQGSMPNYCPNCGSARGSSNFCPSCGYRYI